MTKYARLSASGDVIDVSLGDPASRFPAHLVSEFQTVPDHITRGWRLVSGNWIEKLKPEIAEPEPQENGVSKTLSQVDFVTLVQTVAQISEASFVTVYEDPALKSLWIKLSMATNGVARDHPLVQSGLDALVSAGHITEADKDMVIETWPMEGDAV